MAKRHQQQNDGAVVGVRASATAFCWAVDAFEHDAVRLAAARMDTAPDDGRIAIVGFIKTHPDRTINSIVDVGMFPTTVTMAAIRQAARTTAKVLAEKLVTAFNTKNEGQQ